MCETGYYKQEAGSVFTDPLHFFEGLVKARLRVEHTFYLHTKHFESLWAFGQVLCSLGEENSLIINF